MQVKSIDARLTLGGDYEVILTVPRGERENVKILLEEFKAKAEKVWEAVIGVKKRRRSLDANAYMWVLCDKIAEKLRTTKEGVYREAIKQVGVFDTLLLQDKAVESFVSMWNRQGVGNYAEVLYQSHAVEGCTTVRAYHGSHLYDTGQMTRLIDHIVEEAQGQGVETKTPDELERLKSLWR
ncbi:hypothetical protein Ami103574_02450 [Aminipila butyrica]|uniref:Uncharacterized protein n=1 Tax=Aminipila butyrica TaxID=433296 RepID=A0A858BTH8_9FIRM|nr:hypothetical protein [Aminipila butyrica]QIB68240.1 hypothetical protein Ami103574_02450 [Aminipila butyrica]